jgi:hypothetical protein
MDMESAQGIHVPDNAGNNQNQSLCVHWSGDTCATLLNAHIAGLPDDDNSREFMQCKELLLEASDVRSSIRKAASQAEAVMNQLQTSISKDCQHRRPPAALCSSTLKKSSIHSNMSTIPVASTRLKPSACGALLSTASSASKRTFSEFYRARRAMPECPVLPFGSPVRSRDSKLGQVLAHLRPVSPLPVVQHQLQQPKRPASADKIRSPIGMHATMPISPSRGCILMSSTYGVGLVTAPDR